MSRMHGILRVLVAGALLISTLGHLFVHGVYLLRKEEVVQSTGVDCTDCDDLQMQTHRHDAEADFHAVVHKEHGDHGGSEGVSPTVIEVRAVSPVEATLPEPSSRPESDGGVEEARLVAQVLERGIFRPPRKGV